MRVHEECPHCGTTTIISGITFDPHANSIPAASSSRLEPCSDCLTMLDERRWLIEQYEAMKSRELSFVEVLESLQSNIYRAMAVPGHLLTTEGATYAR